MGIRGELYTQQIKVENRTYFFNVKENSKGDVFLQVVESKMSEGVGFDRHSVVVFEEEMRVFLQGLDKCVEFIEKNRATRLKEAAKKRIAKNKPDAAKIWKAPNKKDGKEAFKSNPTKKRVFLKKKQD
ncbi:MAG: PUR family DNA/RNA-binding protein [Treponema sp.]